LHNVGEANRSTWGLWVRLSPGDDRVDGPHRGVTPEGGACDVQLLECYCRLGLPFAFWWEIYVLDS